MEENPKIDFKSNELISKNEWILIWERLRKKKLAMISLVFIVIIYGAGLFAPLVAPYSYTETNLDRGLEGPSQDHWLGTDRLGRDMLSRCIYSARTTLVVTTAVVISGSLIIGNFLGLLAGYKGGWIDSFIMRVGEVFSSLPGLLMLILINATLGERVIDGVRWFEEHTFLSGIVSSGLASYLTVFAALSLFFWVGTARIIRSQVLQLREREFIIAAESLGASPRRIIFVHLLPGVLFLIILQISATLGGIAGSEILLSWFGVGVQPPAASFGAMIFQGSGARTFQAHPHLLLVPGVVVTILLFSFALLGDALNDAISGR
ncbi:MAG: peptide ABC transporter permease [Chloroflexi bacterium]|nr:peptide ABC transporter permease [Chloroflexota bacterium]|tara:strand:+ start:1912 stop:2871 length:960 start_codon:yes stop_codon:yes gene_type:complete